MPTPHVRKFTRGIVRGAVAAIAVAVSGLIAMPPSAVRAQDMLQQLDLNSPAFTKAEMTRADIEAALAKLKPGDTLDLSGKLLNGLDLTDMDLTRTRLQAAKLNNAKLSGAKFDGVNLDSAWAIKSDFTGASFIGASMFQTQLVDSKLDGCNFAHAMVGADMTRASVRNGDFSNAMLAPDLTNQSMGLMRGVLKSATLDGASFANANLRRSAFEFASLRGADFSGADLTGAELAGADFTGANVEGANFTEADVNSTKLIDLKGAPIGLDRALNLDRASRQ